MKKQSLLALILIIQLGSLSAAQQPVSSPAPKPAPAGQRPQQPEDEDVVRITTNLVQVDAVVTDKSGRVVTDLRPEEVQVFEDGKQQRISHFSYIVTGAEESAAPVTRPSVVDKSAPPVPPSRLKPENIKRTMAIVVDDLGLSFQSTAYVRTALRKYVNEQMQPGDLVAIVRTAGGMGALQQFTSDKRQLNAAIERIRYYLGGRAGVGAFAPLGSNTVAAAGDNQQAASDELDRFREDVFAVGTLGAIGYVIRGLRELPGRKSIILVSDGIKIFNGVNLNRDKNFGSASTDPASDNRVLRALQRLTDQANRASVVIYSMDARGLPSFGLQAADSTAPGPGQAAISPDQLEQQLSDRRSDYFESQNGLNYLAQQTGGFFIHDTNDLGRGIRRVLEDQRGYYLIGYRPEESTFDPRTGRRRFHHLSMKVTRPGKYSVRIRNGFFGVTDEENKPGPRTAEQQLVGALTSPFGSSAVRLQLTSLFGNTPSGSIMRSLLHIDANDLTFTDEADGTHKSVIDILVVTFGDNGVPVDQSGPSYTIRLGSVAYKEALKDGFIYTVTVPIKKPGAYQLRVALRDSASERVGSASQFVEVPDLKKNRLALSGIVINGITAAEFKRLTSGSPAAGPSLPAAATPQVIPVAPAGAQNSGTQNTDAGVEGDPQSTAAVRHFHIGMGLQYGYVIYNAQLDRASGRPQLTTQVRLFRDGKLVFTGRENPVAFQNPADMKRLIAGGAIQLGTDLIPGDYVLQIVVNDALADEKHRTATQWMDFEMIK
jgi:VWFA-related protein